jgi:hypothetical protein
MDRKIKIVRRLEQVFEPHRMAFEELWRWGRGKQLQVTIFLQRKKNDTKKY